MSDADALRQRIINDWSAATAGWRKWEPHIVAFSWPMTLRLVDALELSPGDCVLDVGCGIGDPAVAIAQKVGPTGRVTAIDPAAEMVETASARATSLGLTNIGFKVVGVEDFEAAPHSFDAACGRWSFIFCPDVVNVLRRVRTWLKPGGRFAMSTWTPQKGSPGFAAVNAALNRQVQLPPLDSTKPCMLQLSDPGQLEAALAAAGFEGIHVEPVPLATVVRDGREYWEMTYEMGSSLRTVYDSLTPAQRDAVAAEVIAAVEPFRRDKVLRIPALAQIGWARA
ncbi:MAG TPA: class I SAM-dependent methyltransferase [Phycisphaerae bacterium]|nr:class I SAM-dependent methyltransferase [Phycisphaerae bacterium]